MNHQQQNQFGAHVNVNLSNQYLLQVQQNNGQCLLDGQRKPVGVFWDIENCSIPKGLSPSLLVQKIRALFFQFNFIENEFVVVCDVFGISHNVITELNNMQVNIIHVCSFSKNACDEKLKQLMIRFVNTHGQNCAIILFSSDINFAPILTDFKNRNGVFVILFHHQQVSSALLASSNYHFDYDEFCCLPFNDKTSIKQSIDEDYNPIMTSLLISNLPRLNDENQIRTFLNRITGNVGGRITNINMVHCEATVSFKCRSDALRCHQRINNRKFHGQHLRARVEANGKPNQIHNRHHSGQDSVNQVGSKEFCNRIMIMKNSNRILNGKDSTSVENPNICLTCMIKGRRRSRYSNFMSENQILSVHISLEKLGQGLNNLLVEHSGKLPFNALPDCWLNNFDEELDSDTNPTVMLEHLVSSLPNILLKNFELEEQKIVKYIVFRSESIINESSHFGRRRTKKLNKFSNNIQSLLMKKTPNEFTKFPSIKLKDIANEYYNHFNEYLDYEKYGFSDLFEFLSYFDSKFNFYSFGNDFLIALNFDAHLNRFISHFSSEVEPFISSSSELNRNSFEFVHNYFKTKLDPSVYGVCFIEDLINALIEKESNSFENINLNNIKSILINYFPVNQNSKAVLEFKNIMPKLKQMLCSISDFSFNLKEFHLNFLQILQTKANIKCSYFNLLNLIVSYGENNFQIVFSDENPDQIVLSPECQFIEVGQRFVKIFNELEILSRNDYERNTFNVAISIYELLYHYNQRHKTSSIIETITLAKLFEKIIAYFFEFEIHLNYCLVYAQSNIYLLKFDDNWKEQAMRHLFKLLFENQSNMMIQYEHAKRYFQVHFGFHFGLSFLCHKDIQNMFQISKNDENELTIEFNSFGEFACKFLTVILLHEKIAFPESDIFDGRQQPKWTLDQIENEFYDHFGISMQYSIGYCDLSQLLTCFHWLFDADSSQNFQTIQMKQCPLFDNVNYENITTCNYCETKPSHYETLNEIFSAHRELLL